MICYVQFLKHHVCDICIYLYIHINEKKRTLGVTRGSRPTTTNSRPSHILLIFSSVPPRNPRPFNIILLKCLILPVKIWNWNFCKSEKKSQLNSSFLV